MKTQLDILIDKAEKAFKSHDWSDGKSTQQRVEETQEFLLAALHEVRDRLNEIEHNRA